MKIQAKSAIRKSLALAALLALGAGSSAHAGSLSWNGSTTGGATGVSNTWDTATANWTGAATTWPASSTGDDDALFGGTAGTVTLTTVTANDIAFDTTGYTLSGGTLTLDGATTPTPTFPAITNATGIDATISSIIAGSSGLTKAGAGTLTLSGLNTFTGGLTLGTNAGTILSGFSASQKGISTGSVAIGSGSSVQINNLYTSGNNTIANVFSGSGTLVFNFAANTTARNTILSSLGGFSGAIQLTSAGTTGDKLNISNMGTSGASLLVNSGQTVYTGAGTNVFSGGVTISGTGNNEGLGAIRLESASTLGGTVTLAADARIRGTNATTSILSGNIQSGAAGTQILNLDNAFTASGVIGGGIGTIAIDKTTNATVILSGNNTYTGTTTISAGPLQLNHANALGGSTLITTNATAANDAALALGNGIVTGLGKTIKIAADGNNYGALTAAAGNSGTAEWKGAVTIDATTGARIGSQGGNLLVSGAIGETTANSELILRSVESGAPASVTLTNNNSYSGATIIGSGIVYVGTIGNSGSNSPLGTSGTIKLGLAAVNGARLIYTGTGETTNKVIDLVGTTGGIAIDHSGTNLLKFSNSFTATGGGAKTLTLRGDSSGTGEIAGAIVDNSATNRTSLAKDGGNTWVLSGTNSYTGGTTLRSGTLKLDYSTNNTSKLSDTTSALTLGDGTLELYGGSHIEVVTSTTLAGNTQSFIKRTNAPDPAPAATSVLRMNAMTRNAGSSIDFAADGIADTDTSNTNGILGGWATVAGTAWATSATSAADTPITALSTYTLSSVAGDTAANYTNNNISIDSSQSPAAVISPNSLRFNDANARTLTLATGNNIISSGGILVTSNVGNNLSTISGGTLTLPTAGGNLMLHQNNTANKLLIESIIANNTGTLSILKTGAGEAELAGLDTYTGGLVVNGGTLTLSGNRSGGNAMGAINVGMTSGSNATLNISNGTYAMGGSSLLVGGAQGTPITATVNQSGGAVTFTGGNALLLGNAGTTATTGDYNLSAGSITTNFAAASTNRGLIIGTNANSKATFTLSGTGQLNLTGGGFNTTLQIGRYDSDADNTTAKFLQTGTSTATIGGLSMGGNSDTGSDGSATLELTGGTFTAATFDRLAAGNRNNATILIGGTADVTLPAFPATRGTGATATLYFDGGVLKPLAASTTYLGGLTNAFIQDGGAKFSVDTSKDITVSQNLLEDSGSTGGGLAKEGAGILTLTGSGTYTGTTLVTAGTLALGHASNTLPDAGAINVNGGTLSLGENSDSVGTVTLTSGSISGTTGVLTGSSYAVQAGTISAKLGGAAGMTKSTSGTVTLSGANSFTGNIAVNEGTLAFSTGLSLSATPVIHLGDTSGSATATVQWINNSLATGNAVVVRSGSSGTKSMLVNTGVTGTIASLELNDNLTKGNDGTLSVTGGTTLKGGDRIITVNNAGTLTLGGALSSVGGTYNLAKTGAGILRLNGNNSGYAGNVTFSQASLHLGHTNALGTGAFINNTNTNTLTNVSGAAITLSNSSYSVSSSLIFGGSASTADIHTGPGAFALAGSQRILSVNGGVTTTIGGAISGDLRKDGSGTLVLAGTGASLTGIRVVQGNLQLTGSTAATTNLIQGHPTGTNVGKFVLGGTGGAVNQTFGSLSTEGGAQTSQSIVGGNAALSTLTVNQSTTTTYQGVIGGAGTNENNLALTKDGSGSLALTSVNTYTGDTTVTGGTLSLGNGTANTGLANGADVIVAGGATLNLNFLAANTDTVDELWINGVQKSPGVYGSSDPSGQITGTGTLTVTNGPAEGTPFSSWMAANYPGLTGDDAKPGADPDGDGANNLLEFALHGDPTSASDNGYSVVASEDSDGDTIPELTLTIAVRNGEGTPTFTGSPVPVASVDKVKYSIQGSLDLVFPSSAVVTETSAPTGLPALPSGWEYRRFMLNDSESLPDKGFLRVKIEEVP